MQYQNAEIKPWERGSSLAPKESDKAWQAFMIHRDAGTSRTLISTCEKFRQWSLENKTPKEIGENQEPEDKVPEKRQIPLYKSRSYAVIRQWSKINNWPERCRHFDNWTDRQQRALKNGQIKEMNGRHANIAVAAQSLVIKRLAKISAEEMALMDLKQVMDVARMAVTIERTARGEPDVITQESLTVDVNSTHTERTEMVLSVRQVMESLPTDQVALLEKLLRASQEKEKAKEIVIEAVLTPAHAPCQSPEIS